MNPKKTFKGQSAMEYLMTYGWAILIIAIVLAALFSLGVFSGSTLPNACIAQSGFSCSTPVYSHTTGNVVVTVGQSTGSSWASANFVFMNASTLSTFQSSGTFPSFPGNSQITNLYSGGVQSVTLPVSAASTALGTGVSGQVWARYATSAGGTAYYTEVAILTAKAV